MKPVNITQTLVSVQGEGVSVGKPVLLIRLNGCNIKCSFCDSSWTNEKLDCKPFDYQNNNKTPFEINDDNIDSYIRYIKETLLSEYCIHTVLFTGGEPFLHTDFLSEFIDKTETKFNIFEIETNGTLLYKELTFIQREKHNIQLNISPKLKEYPKKYNEDFKKALFLISTYENNNFLKFVYAQDLEKSILNFIKIDDSLPVVISPLTPPYESENFYEKYRARCLKTLDFCLRNGLRYSPREHVFLFGSEREEFKSLKGD